MKYKIYQEKEIYACFKNSDLTEGRGLNYCHALSENKATAYRLAKGQDVQGSNSKISNCKMLLIKEDGEAYGSWYAPAGYIHKATDEDLKEEKRINNELAKKILIDKFKSGEEITKEERLRIVELLGEK